jgi:hypothetical protein
MHPCKKIKKKSLDSCMLYGLYSAIAPALKDRKYEFGEDNIDTGYKMTSTYIIQ